MMQILLKSGKPFNDMVDWHIAAIQERNSKKQKLYFLIYEGKQGEYEELMKELWKEYEQ